MVERRWIFQHPSVAIGSRSYPLEFFENGATRAKNMFCGGSFRCKPSNENDAYRFARRNSLQIRVLRSASVNHGEGFGRRVFVVPDVLPSETKRITLQKNVASVSFILC